MFSNTTPGRRRWCHGRCCCKTKYKTTTKIVYQKVLSCQIICFVYGCIYRCCFVGTSHFLRYEKIVLKNEDQKLFCRNCCVDHFLSLLRHWLDNKQHRMSRSSTEWNWEQTDRAWRKTVKKEWRWGSQDSSDKKKTRTRHRLSYLARVFSFSRIFVKERSRRDARRKRRPLEGMNSLWVEGLLWFFTWGSSMRDLTRDWTRVRRDFDGSSSQLFEHEQELTTRVILHSVKDRHFSSLYCLNNTWNFVLFLVKRVWRMDKKESLCSWGT